MKIMWKYLPLVIGSLTLTFAICLLSKLSYDTTVITTTGMEHQVVSTVDSDNAVNERLDVKERYVYSFKLGGTWFGKNQSKIEIFAQVSTALTHSFSPYIERETARRFIDPPHTNVFYANSPAIKWFKGEIVLVARIWLDRERYEAKDNWPANHFADNWLYSQRYNRQMKPVNNATILGIPLPKQWWVGDGPIEPRLCIFKNRLFITFNSAMAFKHNQHIDYTILWDYEQNLPIIPKIAGSEFNTPMVNATEKGEMPRDKHWMAFTYKQQLYFVHNLDPLRILQCTVEGFCRFVHIETNKAGFLFHDEVSHLRGGTPFEQYSGKYYVGLAHCTLYKEKTYHRYYSVHLVVLHVDPYRIVYVSDDVLIHPKIYQIIPIVRAKYIDDGFIFPVGLIVEDVDYFTVGVHVSDHSSVLIRLKGLHQLMSQIIEQDKHNTPTQGPPVGALHQHLHDKMQLIKNMKFVHK